MSRLGLIGYGIWGANILRDLRHLGHEAWVVELSPSGAKALEAGAGGVFATIAELPEVDGLIVATPSSTHTAVIRELVGRNVPILCEKPLTIDVAEAREIVEISGSRLFTGHIWCYHPGIEALAEIARSGELGKVHGIRTTRTNWASPRTDVDSVWNLAPHDLAIAQFILGEIPEPRYALPEMLDGRCVGMVGILGDSPWVAFEVSNRYREKRREVRLHCSDGVAVLRDADAGEIEISRNSGGREPSLEVRPVSKESALRRELASFCDYLTGGPAPITDAAQGLAVVEGIARLRTLAGLPEGSGIPALAATP